MPKSVRIIIVLLLGSVNVIAQGLKSNNVNILFAEGQYSAAQSLYQSIIANDISNEEAHYYNAKCSKELFSLDAVFLYEQFLLNFPFTSFKDEVSEDLALLYFREMNYSKAISYLLKLDDFEKDPLNIFQANHPEIYQSMLNDIDLEINNIL